jgi:quercetin dioxygenase-like cupin family protein
MSGRSEMDSGEERLRPPPAERFKGPSHVFDLDAVADRLRSEDHPSRHGHRQMTLFQRDHITHVAFTFEPDGHLAEHAAPGLVTIHVHSGRLAVKEEGREHDLSSGQVLVLAPGVPHDVRAKERSIMMLTVHVERAER